MESTRTPLIWGEPLVGTETQAPSRFNLPAGTVTFLLSDIEGSTRLWSDFPDAMGDVVAETYGILDRAIGRYDGVRPIEQGEGDSVVGAFSRAADAVAAALYAQRELHAVAWPEGIALRVRIALHTADAQLRDEGNYFGLALSRCARLRSAASGGQTLLSRATRDLVVDQLPEGVELADCGVHRLRDLGRPEHVFALVHPELGAPVTELRSLDNFPNNLPDQLTSFVGRAGELAQLRGALEETRLLTLTGAGGAGKTRLALQLAADVFERFPDGAWWVELAPLADPRLVDEALAAALGVRPLPGLTALEASCAHLSAATALIVVDNCEHLLAACAEMTEALLRGCRDVVVIATSRTQLGIAGETDWRVPSLSLPPPDREREYESLETVSQFDAVRLFIERARKARPNFAVSNANAPAVAQVCQELDGLPLAIELAAARVRMLSVEQIAAGLGDRFHLLTGGTRTALPRYQTLRASVDWSHELLAEPERVLLRRLAVFAGGFTLDLAEAVCADEVVEQVAILDLLASLVDKSLVVAEERAGEVRYRLLETVRQYGRDHLADAHETAMMRDRHRDGLLDFAERSVPELHRPGQRECLEALDREAGNLAAALEHALDTDGERALRLLVALTFWLKWRCQFAAPDRAFARALEAADPAPSSLRAQALWARGYLGAWAGRILRALESLREASAMAEAIGDKSTLARALLMIGWIQLFPDPVGSRPISARARDLGRESGDDWAVLAANMNLVYTHLFCHEFDEGERLAEEMLPLTKEHGYLELLSWHWLGMCLGPWSRGDGERVSQCAANALEFARASGEPSTEALSECFLAELDLGRGDPEAAVSRLERTLARVISAGAGLAVAYTVTFLAPAQAAVGRAAEARAALESIIEGGIDWGYLITRAAVNLAEILRAGGELDEAEVRAGQALEIAQRLPTPIWEGSAKETFGRVAAGRGEWSRAEQLLHEALAIRLEHAVLLHIPQTFDALAEVAAGLGSSEEAARTLGAAHRLREELGLERWALDAPRFAALEVSLRESLGDDTFAAAWAEGRQLGLDEAVVWVRGARGERKRPERGWESLTPTELRVVELVAEGLTNPQIGERMFISRGTVKVHLSHIFAKVNISSRAELAAEATRRAVRSTGP